MANRTGLEIYSEEWWEENSKGIPQFILPAVKRIVIGYQLGNSIDPSIVSEMIREGLAEGITKKNSIFKV